MKIPGETCFSTLNCIGAKVRYIILPIPGLGKYQPGFATPQFPGTHIARLAQQGDYTFFKTDFSGVNSEQAVVAQNAQKTEQGEAIVYHIS